MGGGGAMVSGSQVTVSVYQCSTTTNTPTWKTKTANLARIIYIKNGQAT